jgi:hypothetical protein
VTWAPNPYIDYDESNVTSVVRPEVLGGREAELSRLNEAFHDARSLVMAVRGIRGIGKTSLIQAFIEQSVARAAWIDLGLFQAEHLAGPQQAIQALQGRILEEFSRLGFVRRTEKDVSAEYWATLRRLGADGEGRVVVVLDELDALEAAHRKAVIAGITPSMSGRIDNAPLWLPIIGEAWSRGERGDRSASSGALRAKDGLGPSLWVDMVDAGGLLGVLQQLERYADLAPAAPDELAQLAADLLDESGGLPLLFAPLLSFLFERRRADNDRGPLRYDDLQLAAQACARAPLERITHAVDQAGPEARALLFELGIADARAKGLGRAQLIALVTQRVGCGEESLQHALASLVASRILEARNLGGNLEPTISVRGQVLTRWAALLDFNLVLQRATTSTPEAIAAWEEGCQFERERRFDEALAAYDRALELDPQFVHAKRARARGVLTLSSPGPDEVRRGLKLIGDLARSGPLDGTMFEVRAQLLTHEAAHTAPLERGGVLGTLRRILDEDRGDRLSEGTRSWIRKVHGRLEAEWAVAHWHRVVNEVPSYEVWEQATREALRIRGTAAPLAAELLKESRSAFERQIEGLVLPGLAGALPALHESWPMGEPLPEIFELAPKLLEREAVRRPEHARALDPRFWTEALEATRTIPSFLRAVGATASKVLERTIVEGPRTAVLPLTLALLAHEDGPAAVCEGVDGALVRALDRSASSAAVLDAVAPMLAPLEQRAGNEVGHLLASAADLIDEAEFEIEISDESYDAWLAAIAAEHAHAGSEEEHARDARPNLRVFQRLRPRRAVELIGKGDEELVRAALGDVWKLKALLSTSRDETERRRIRQFHVFHDKNLADATLHVFELADDVIRYTWHLQRRMLGDLSTRRSGRALPRLLDAQELRSRGPGEPDRGILLTKDCPTASLRDKLRASEGRFHPTRRADLAPLVLELAKTLHLMHTAGYLHRNIRTDTIYVDHLVERLELGGLESAFTFRSPRKPGADLFHRIDRHIAPEVLRARTSAGGGPSGEGSVSDVYAFGLVLFEIFVRALRDDELTTFVAAAETSYGDQAQREHREWLGRLVDEAAVREQSLDRPVARVLRQMLAFAPSDRRGGLDAAIQLLQELCTRSTDLESLGVLVAGPGVGEAQSRWIGEFLARTRFYDEAGHSDLYDRSRHKDLVVALERYLVGAKLYRNPFGGRHPLVLIPQSGTTYFRVRPLSDLGEIGGQYAFLEVLLDTRWTPPEPPIAYLTRGISVSTISNDAISAARAGRLHGGGWGLLFPDPARPASSPEMVRVSRMLRLSMEAEYHLQKKQIRVSVANQLACCHPSDPTKLADVIAAWIDRFAITTVRFRVSGEKHVFWEKEIDEKDLDHDAQTVRLRGLEHEGEGVLEPASNDGLEMLLNRRRRVLPLIEDDEFLLEKLIAPEASDDVIGTEPAFFDDGLDEDKQRIVRKFLRTRPLLTVQGPPGTGKTTLAAELILQARRRGDRIAVLSQGHEPLDNLLERLLEALSNTKAGELLATSSIVRIMASTTRARSEVGLNQRSYVLAERVWTRVQNARAAAETQAKGLAKGGQLPPECRALLDATRGLQTAPSSLVRRIEDAAAIVFGTLNSSLVEARELFDLVIIEEAARATPLEIAMAMRLARRWLLIGDHAQIAAYALDEIQAVFEERLEEERADSQERRELVASFVKYKELFKHLQTTSKTPRSSDIISTQWRMHPRIGALVSDVFYKNSRTEARLKNPTGVAHERLLASKAHPFKPTAWLSSKDAVVWVDTSDYAGNGGECVESYKAGIGCENRGERRVILGLLKALRPQSRVALRRPDSLAILSPYRDQVNELKIWLKERDSANFAHLGLSPAQLADCIFTVDAFQGRQAAVVIVSLVRTNDIGFMKGAQRPTVLFSRAESLLVVVGKMAIFEGEQAPEHWRDVCRHPSITHVDPAEFMSESEVRALKGQRR